MVKYGKYVSFNGKKYAFNYDKLKELCLSSSKDGNSNEFEISQAYEADDSGELRITSKVEHETRISGNQQNDMIIYDLIKLFIVSLLENTSSEKDFTFDFGTAISLNTLVRWKIIEEITE